MVDNPGDADVMETVPAPATARAETMALSTDSSAFTATADGKPGEPVAAVFERLGEQLSARAAEVAGLMVYGSVADMKSIALAMTEVLGERQWPVTWIEGKSCDGAILAGVQAFAVRNRPVSRVRLGPKVVGSVYAAGGLRHCLLGGLGPTDRSLGATAQVRQTLGNLEWALDLAGFELADVVRTWFYNDNILGWYDDFNRVRSAHYAGVEWRSGSPPASTGIGARNTAGAALEMGAWAMRPLGGGRAAREIGSPLQCPAPAYGSAFSRAMEVVATDSRHLLVSGTASIHPGGETAWTGNVAGQVELTMEVVAAILRSRGLAYSDVTRATAYYRDPRDQPVFAAWAGSRGLERMPVVHTHSVICRDDLLFEIEIDAAGTRPVGPAAAGPRRPDLGRAA